MRKALFDLQARMRSSPASSAGLCLEQLWLHRGSRLQQYGSGGNGAGQV